MGTHVGAVKLLHFNKGMRLATGFSYSLSWWKLVHKKPGCQSGEPAYVLQDASNLIDLNPFSLLLPWYLDEMARSGFKLIVVLKSISRPSYLQGHILFKWCSRPHQLKTRPVIRKTQKLGRLFNSVVCLSGRSWPSVGWGSTRRPQRGTRWWSCRRWGQWAGDQERRTEKIISWISFLEPHGKYFGLQPVT